MFLWQQFIQDIAYSKAAWEKASPFQLFSVDIEEDDKPPVCVLVCKAFLHFLKCWTESRIRGAVCIDSTWKICVAEWCLTTICGMASHYVAQDGMRRSMGLPLSLTLGQKESTPVLSCAIKCTLAFYEKHFGISLVNFVVVAMWDATLAGAAAHQYVVPHWQQARCLRHQISKAKEVAPKKCEGDKETKGIAAWLVVGSIQFSAFNLWEGRSFHEYWDEVQARLVSMKQIELLKWLKEYVLFWDNDKQRWCASWWSGLMCGRRPGMSTYLPQVIESLQDTLKDALPPNIRHKEPSTAVRKLGTAIEAVAKKRCWVEAASGSQEGQKWVLTDKLEREIQPQLFANYTFSPRFVNGKRLLTDHLLAEDNEQWPVLTMDDLIPYLLGNFKNIGVEDESVDQLYVVPAYHENLEITTEMCEATRRLLFPHRCSEDDLRQAKEFVGVRVQDSGKTRYSIHARRRLGAAQCCVH